MQIKYEDASHYIDRQFGSVMYISTDKDGKITGVDDRPDYKGKLEAKLIGKTIDEAKAFLSDTFKGIYMYIKTLH